MLSWARLTMNYLHLWLFLVITSNLEKHMNWHIRIHIESIEGLVKLLWIVHKFNHISNQISTLETNRVNPQPYKLMGGFSIFFWRISIHVIDVHQQNMAPIGISRCFPCPRRGDLLWSRSRGAAREGREGWEVLCVASIPCGKIMEHPSLNMCFF